MIETTIINLRKVFKDYRKQHPRLFEDQKNYSGFYSSIRKMLIKRENNKIGFPKGELEFIRLIEDFYFDEPTGNRTHKRDPQISGDQEWRDWDPDAFKLSFDH